MKRAFKTTLDEIVDVVERRTSEIEAWPRDRRWTTPEKIKAQRDLWYGDLERMIGAVLLGSDPSQIPIRKVDDASYVSLDRLYPNPKEPLSP